MKEGVHQRLCCAGVACAARIFYVADSRQGPDICVVRVGGERVDEKERRCDFALRDHAANLLIATERAACDLARNLEAELLLKRGASASGGDNLHRLEEVAVLFDKC